MTEDDRLIISPAMWFPEAAKRVRVLEELKRSWASIVGIPNSRYSSPVVLGVNKIVVAAANKQVSNMLAKMKGNIMRALSSRLALNPDSKFEVNIYEYARWQRKTKYKLRSKIKNVKVDDEKVKEYMNNAPETLPEDINYSLSHLMAFIDAAK